jgi:hypothetical protein
MRTENEGTNSRIVPFLFRFKEPIPERNRTLRYDTLRQISQVFVEGKWIDGHDRSAPPIGSSRFTRVDRETSDDA